MRTLQILEEEVKNCTRCELCKTRKQTVFARGNPLSKIVFIGQDPGEDEDREGLPFVGRSGKLLDKVLVELGLDPAQDVYIFNTVKCHTPQNRGPSDEELNACLDFFEEQLKLVSPKVAVALGATSMNNLINTTYSITKVHGQFFKRKDCLVMPAYHPSYVIRNGSKGPIYDSFKQDLQLAINKVRE